MSSTKQWQKACFSWLVISTMIINGLTSPAAAQDIVTSEDIAGGSSIFVFKQSRKTAQLKSAFRTSSVKGIAARGTPRKRFVNPPTGAAGGRKRTPKIDPNQVASAKASTKTGKTAKGGKQPNTENTKTSIALAGAAETFLDNNEFDNAVEYFTAAVELNPKNESARQGLSEALTRKGDEVFDKTKPEAAAAFYERAVQYNVKNAAAYAGLAEVYEASNADAKAIENYEKALAQNANLTEVYAPLGMLYFRQGDIARSDNYLTKAVAKNQTDADLQYYVGLLRYRQNRSDEAIAAFKNTIQANPQAAEAHYYLGETYDRLGRDADALAEYSEAVKINRDYLDAWFDLGVANYNQGRYEESIAAYKQALRLKNDYGQAHANLAEVYRQMAMDAKDLKKKQGFFDLANGEYAIAAASIKNDPELYNSWAYCLGRVKKWDAAAERLNQAAALVPDASYYTNIGWAHLNSARGDLQYSRNDAAKAKLEKGKAALQKAVAVNPKYFAGYMNLGLTLQDLGDYQGVVDALKIAVGLRADWYPANLELGVAYRQLKDLDNAVVYLKKATELNDKISYGWYWLGETEFQRGNKEAAKRALDKLKKLDPNSAKRLNSILSGAIPMNPQNKNENKAKGKKSPE